MQPFFRLSPWHPLVRVPHFDKDKTYLKSIQLWTRKILNTTILIIQFPLT